MHNNFAFRPVTEDQLRAKVPSVFSTEAHESRSSRFRPIPTIDIVRGLQKDGWEISRAEQQRTRDESRRAFTKHMLRFRRPDRTDLRVGDNILEMLLVNGNDGSAAYSLDAGIFRVACMNGMIVKSKDFGGVKIRHTGNAVDEVVEASYEVLAHANAALEAPEKWGRIQLNDRERFAFARGAAIERWGVDEDTGNLHAPLLRPEQLLTARRVDDQGRDLWSTFNVVQENVMKGGLRGRTATNRRTTTRRVGGLSEEIKLNRGLWEMAEWLSTHAEKS